MGMVTGYLPSNTQKNSHYCDIHMQPQEIRMNISSEIHIM